MEAHVLEWLQLALRWFHVIAAMAWIGASFYFNWLDNSLEPPPADRPQLKGDLWAVHGGGFYHVEKLSLTPSQLPQNLHWFKWEAYSTWISGFFLLSVLYYGGGGRLLIDPAVADISLGTAAAISLGTLFGGWFVYDLLWQSPLAKKRGVAEVLSLGLLVGAIYGLAQVFSARAAFLHTGALLGTFMAGNVLVRIIPAQRQMVDATKSGGTPDAARGANAKRRSTHNNYMTLPVIFAMISAHYPSAYGHAYNWLVLIALGLIGAASRHFFNLRHQGRVVRWLLPVCALAFIAVAVAVAPEPTPEPDAAALANAPPFPEVRAVVARRCGTCHSAQPTDPAFAVAPKGVMFDTPAQIRAQAAQIKQQSVTTRIMPLGNLTGMTDEERALVGAWVDADAPLR